MLKKFLVICFAVFLICLAKISYSQNANEMERQFDIERKHLVKFLSSLKVGTVVNGWKVEKIIVDEGDYRATFMGKIIVKTKYAHAFTPPKYEGLSYDFIYFFIPKDIEKKLPYYGINAAEIEDKNFSGIPQGSYGFIEAEINKIDVLLVSNDTDKPTLHVSKVISFKEVGRVNYGDGEDQNLVDRQDEIVDKFLEQK